MGLVGLDFSPTVAGSMVFRAFDYSHYWSLICIFELRPLEMSNERCVDIDQATWSTFQGVKIPLVSYFDGEAVQ